MGLLGLHIALSDDELAQLVAVPGNERLGFINETFEAEKFGSPDCCETDKSWAYIHAGLNGTDPDGPLEIGSEPPRGLIDRLFRPVPKPTLTEARFAIVGHDDLHSSDEAYIGLVEKDRVLAVASALDEISCNELGQRVRLVHQRYGASGTSVDAAEYAMSWYPAVVTFYNAAAASRKNVIFTVDF